MPSRPSSRRCAAAVVLAASVAPLVVASAAHASTTGWTRGVVVGRSGVDFLGDEYSNPRVAISADGRGTVAFNRWSGGGSTGKLVATSVRDFSGRATLGPTTVLPRIGSSFVVRDGRGRALVTGAYEPDRGEPRGWLATQTPAGRWSQRLGKGNLAAVIGAASGFDAVVGHGQPGFGTRGPYGLAHLGTGASAQFPAASVLPANVGIDDGGADHTEDGSSFASLPDGTVVSAGWRFGNAASARYPDSPGTPVLLSFSSARSPVAVDLTGATDSFGASAIDTAGPHVALAGLREIPVDDQNVEGVPLYAVGTAAGLSPLRPIPGVASHRGVEVDVAARPDGGAVVTWVEEPVYQINARVGVAHWAQISPAGTLESQGTFSASPYSAHVRIVRVGSTYVAVWNEGIDHHGSRLRSAKLDGTRVRALRAPTGTTLTTDYSDGNAQLVAAGDHAAYVYSDLADHTIKLATLAAR